MMLHQSAICLRVFFFLVVVIKLGSSFHTAKPKRISIIGPIIVSCGVLFVDFKLGCNFAAHIAKTVVVVVENADGVV